MVYIVFLSILDFTEITTHKTNKSLFHLKQYNIVQFEKQHY